MSKRKLILWAALIALLAVAAVALFTAPLREQERAARPAPTPTPGPRVGDVAQKAPLTDDAPLREDKSVYAGDDETSVVTLWLTVREGNPVDNTNHPWKDINTYSAYDYEDMGVPRYKCEAILQVGDEKGPVEGEFGYDAVIPNATVQVRGQTSSRSTLKNFKVRIKEGMGEWRGQRTLALNKHANIALRYNNKLSFDLMKDCPQVTAARTQFVRLYVKDETSSGGKNAKFVNYGIFVMVEQMNKSYLERHGLDKYGQLYKVTFFEWEQYEPVMLLKDEEDYDQKAFEEYLEIKGNDDHSKLQEAINAVNNDGIPITEVVDKYFDVENLTYWMAFHILMGNSDTGARNLFLYSPLNSQKWYILSWDIDVAWRRTYYSKIRHYEEGMSWENGMSQFLGIKLFNRMFREKQYRDALCAAVEDVKATYLTPERVGSLSEAYAEIVEKYLFRWPDLRHSGGLSRAQYRMLAQSLPGEVDINYQYFLESLEKPWPFYTNTPERTPDGRIYVSSDISYDVDGENITYSCYIAKDYSFKNILVQETGLRVPQFTFDLELKPGRYFLRIQATNASGYTQDAFDYYHGDDVNGKIYGCLCFVVNEDGTIQSWEEAQDEQERV